MLPEYAEITQWDDEKLKNVHYLLFDMNISPAMGETREEVDDYLYIVHLIYEQKFGLISK